MSTMGVQKHAKLNRLQQILPEGLPVDSTWLQEKGYSRQLVAKYVHHRWLISPVRGVFQRKSAHIDQRSWEPIVISLQNLLEFPISVGGRTALELQGHTHYVAMSASSEIHLFGNKVPPSWVARLKLDRHIVFHSVLLFKSTRDGLRKTDPDQQKAYFMEQNWRASEWTIRISTPERAILEVIDELPNHESFHQVDVLMEGLSNLRPQYLNRLLADCQSVKTKRLFLWFAHRHNHAWFKMIDSEKIDIGKGKRMIVSGGRLDPKYLITVPEEFANDRQRAM